MGTAKTRDRAIDETYTSLRRTIGAFHSLHRGASKGRMTRPQTFLMRVIALRGRSTPKELAEFLGLTQGTITSSLDRLEDEGLIKRTRSTKDRRVVVVRLTPTARRAMGAIERDARAQLSTLFEGWTLREIEALRGLLNRLAERAWEECGPPPFLRGTPLSRTPPDKG